MYILYRVLSLSLSVLGEGAKRIASLGLSRDNIAVRFMWGPQGLSESRRAAGFASAN